MKKSRYIPNLPKMAAQCEANYIRLLKLLPTKQSQRTFLVTHQGQTSRISIIVEQEHRYTTDLLIQQFSKSQQWLPSLNLQVRMYHDANMAEVLSYQQQSAQEGRYTYPNAQMYAPDEKAQLNSFLSDWLSHCLRFGVAEHPPVIANEI